MSEETEHSNGVAEQSKHQRRILLQRLTHEAILAGRLDKGPEAEHTAVEKDIRDMRDPTELGKRIISTSVQTQSCATEAADQFDAKPKSVPRYEPSEMMGHHASETYQAELRARAANGDRFAISVLETGKPGDSDE